MRRAVLISIVLAGAALLAPPVTAAPVGTVVAGHGRLASGANATVAAFDLTGKARGLLRVESAPGFVFVSKVRCIRRVGDRVLVGGVIVRSPTPGTLGHTSMIAVEDGGPGGEDRLGFAFSNSGLDSCPDIALPMHPLASGNFVVR